VLLLSLCGGRHDRDADDEKDCWEIWVVTVSKGSVLRASEIGYLSSSNVEKFISTWSGGDVKQSSVNHVVNDI